MKTMNKKIICTWGDLSLEQKQVAIRQYISIRENEEQRRWDDITSNTDYDEPINWEGVKNHLFEIIDSENNLFIII